MLIGEKQISNLKDVINIQSQYGTYNCNAYMWGLGNGLILSLAILMNEEPKYLNKPERFLDDDPINLIESEMGSYDEQ